MRSTKNRRVFCRILSALLTLCMVMSVFPLSVLAYDAADETMTDTWRRMIEIGIVNEDGDINEETRFDFADGRTAMSITEFLDMIDSEDTDPDMSVRVWGNGSEATIQEIVYALSIEYQMQDISSSMRYLADGSMNQAVVFDEYDAETNDAAQTAQVKEVPKLVCRAETYTSESGNIFLDVNFELKDSKGDTVESDGNVTFEVGLFGDIKGLFDSTVQIYGTTTFGDLAGINEYVRRTIPEGESSASISYPVSSHLKNAIETIYDEFSKNHVSPRPDFLSGTLPFVVQVTDLKGAVIENNGLWTDSTTIKLSYDRSEQGSVEFEGSGKTITGNDIGSSLTNDDLTQINTLRGDSSKEIKSSFVFELSDEVLGLDDSKKELMRHSDDIGIRDYLNIRVAIECNGDFDFSQEGGTVDLFVKYSDGKWYHNFIENYGTMGINGNDGVYTLRSELEAFIPYEVTYTPGRWDKEKGTVNVIVPQQVAYIFYNSKYKCEVTEATKIEISNVKLNKINSTSGLTKPYSAPEVRSISVIGDQTTFSVGQCVPILVKFYEPVKGTYTLTVNESKVDNTKIELIQAETSNDFVKINNVNQGANNETISSSRLFLYKVQAVDATTITVKSVSGTDAFSINGIAFEKYETTQTLNVTLKSTLPEHSINNNLAVNAEEVANAVNKETLTYTITADTLTAGTDDTAIAYRQMWANYSLDINKSGFKVMAVFDDDYSENAKIKPVLMYAKGDNNKLTGTVEISKKYNGTDDVISHSVRLYILRDGNYTPVNSSISFTEIIIEKVPKDAYELKAENDKLYSTDATAYAITLTKKSTDSYTYENDIELVCSVEEIVTLNKDKGDNNKFLMIPGKAGVVEIYARAKNGSIKEENYTKCSNTITITVQAGSNPSIIFPKNANTYLTRAGEDCTLMFASNLDSLSVGNEGDIRVELITADENTTVYSSTIARDSKQVKIPGECLTKVSENGEAAYIVKLTADVSGEGASSVISAEGYIIVLPQPAKVELKMPETLISDTSIDISWEVKDLKDGEVEFWIEKDDNVLSKITDSELNDNYSNSTSYTFEIDNSNALKENYLVIVRARNSGDDAWSSDSRIVTVYRKGALDIEIGGEKRDSYTLKNDVDSSTTTTSPEIKNTSGKTISGLNNASAIAALRSELGLLESISINKSDFTWGTRSDMIKWSADADIDKLRSVLTLNYRQGSVYEPLSNFSYIAYIPEAVLMLCGLNDGTATVTAEHNSVSELSDTVTVNVEKLKNKLYLFSFTPAATTKLTYTDGNGVVHNVETNSDGSLALYEPNGIASDVNCYSESKGEKYLGTITKQSLKSGEGNGTKSELYPMNSASLRKAALAEIILTKPDGTPYTGNVTIRGGVYRNLPYAENRDDAYCADAKFAAASDEPASLDGKSDMAFKADASGKLSIYMDMTRFTTKNDTDQIDFHEDVQYIFELRIDGYYPSLVTFDSNLTIKDAMRKGENRVSLTEAENPEIFVAAQTVDYGTGRKIKITDNTSRVGPNPTYTSAEFETTIMLWGVNTDGCDYDAVLRQQNVHKEFSTQVVLGTDEATYPFSSIKLIKNIVTFNEEAFADFDTDLIKAEYKIYDKNKNGIGCVISVRPRIANLINRERIDESANLLSLMANIGMFGAVDGNESSGGILNTVKDAGEKVVTSALEFATKLGGETGIVKCVLTPTDDPARFTGYFWTGMNTLKMDDLEYDENGISFEPTLLDMQLNDTFSVSDFKSMADGSYFEDRSSLWGAVSNGVIGLPVSLVLEGWFATDIRFNLDKGEWEILMTGGGFTAGAELQYETARDILVGPSIPITYSIKLRGGVVVDFKTAIRYAEELGEGWDDEKAKTVNDYLTALRINAYVELFGGLGKGKNVTCKIGAFGSLEVDNENRFLTKNYLKSEKLKGQYLKLEGQVGLKAAIGIGPVELEVTIASAGLTFTHNFNRWEDIQEYWYGKGDNEDGGTDSLALFMGVSSDPGYVVLDSTVRLQSREYLKYGREEYFADSSSVSTYGLRRTPENSGNENTFKTYIGNAYPYSAPMLTDDGEIMVYLDDNKKDSIEDVSLKYAKKSGKGYSAYEPIENKENSDFPGYGDYTFDLDGTKNFAAVTWLRQSVSLGLKPSTTITDEQQFALLNGNEVMVSLWNGSEWTSERLTNNAIREDKPVVAVSQDGSVIVLWKQMQTGENIGETINDAIMYRVRKNGSWSEAYMLYNGEAGEVLDIDAKMLKDGTAAVAYSVSDKSSSDSSEIYYSIVYTQDADLRESVKTIRVTDNEDADDTPVITKTTLDEKEVFALAWHKCGDDSGVMLHDIGFLVFDGRGTPESNIPDTLSNYVSLTNFDGIFDLTDGTSNIEELSVLWNDRKSGNSDNDIMMAVKLGLYDNVYAFSAPIEAAVIPKKENIKTGIQSISASYANGGIITAMATEELHLNDKKKTKYSFVDSETGETIEYTIEVPESQTNLCYAASYFKNAVAVNDIMVDFGTLNTETPTPISFTVTNMGISKMTSVTIKIGDGKEQTFECSLMPGEYSTFGTVYTTGAVIENVDYSCTAEFDGDNDASAKGTVYLDYPDVGITEITVTKQSDSVRNMNIGLYNQSASDLNKSGRAVRYSIYSDSECEKLIDSMYFKGGNTVLINSSEKLAMIDEGILTEGIVFKIGKYVEDLGMKEIPSGGVNLFVKAEIIDGEEVLPEPDKLNNTARINFESLVDIRGEKISVDSYMRQNGSGTSVDVVLTNNSRESFSGGNIIVALYSEDGTLLATKRTYGKGNLNLDGEESKTFTFDFDVTGSYVLVWFTDDTDESPDNTEVTGIYLEGTDLTLDSFGSSRYAELFEIERGQYALTVITSNPEAKVYVDGVEAENGVIDIDFTSTRVYIITVVSPDGSKSTEYRLKLNEVHDNENGGNYGLIDYPIYCTLTFDTNGGSRIVPLRKLFRTTVNLSSFVPEREGYEFTRWYTDAALTKRVTSVLLVRNMTVYAGWEKISDSSNDSVVDEGNEENALPFVDVTERDWFYGDVAYVYENGLMRGTGDKTFSPYSNTTRAMIVTVLYRMEGEPDCGDNIFNDVPAGEYYTKAVAWAAENGIVNGYGQGKFGPDDSITREQLAAILYRYSVYKGYDVSVGEDTNILSFTDIADLSDYAFTAMQWACGSGLINGMGDGMLSPKNNASRCQIAAVLHRFCESIEK